MSMGMTFQEQIDKEADGLWVTVAVLQRRRKKRSGEESVETWTWSHGPYNSQKEAKRGGDRLRTSLKRDLRARSDRAEGSIEVLAVTSRPLWKAGIESSYWKGDDR